MSARAPVDNAIEASIEAIEAICRERCLVVLRTEIQYQNNAGGRHGAELTCREGVKLDLFRVRSKLNRSRKIGGPRASWGLFRRDVEAN